MALGSLLVKIGADIAGFTSGMGTVSQRLTAIDRQAGKAFSGFDKLGTRLTDIGGTLTGAVTLPLGAIAAGALAVAGNFEQSMAKIKAFGDISGTALAGLRQQALDLGRDTQFSAQQAADAMAVFASANFNAQQITAAMPGTLQLAAAGMISVGDAATFVSDVLGQFGLTAGETGRIADVMAEALKAGKATMQELGTTLTYVGPVSRQAGQSLEETTAAIIGLDVAGIRGEKAGTGLRGVLASLVSPSTEAAKIMAELGINVEGAGGKMLPISDIMEQFKSKLSTVHSEVERTNLIFQIFGREAGNSAAILINTGGPALDGYEQKLLKSKGSAESLAKTLNSGLNFALEQLKGSVETAGIALGTALIPTATRVLELVTKLVNEGVLPAINWFSKLPQPVQDGAIAFAAIAAATGPLLIGLGLVLTSVASVGTAFTSVSAGMLSLATGGSIKGLGGAFQYLTTLVNPDFTGALSLGESALNKFGTAAGVVAVGFVVWEGLRDITANLRDASAEMTVFIGATQETGAQLTGLGKIVFGPIVTAFEHWGGALKPVSELLGKVDLAAIHLKTRLLAVSPVLGVVRDILDQLGKTLALLNGKTYDTIDAQGDLKKKFETNSESMKDAARWAGALEKQTKATGEASKLGAKAQQILSEEVKRTAAEHQRANALIKQFEDGIPAAIITEYERKLKAVRTEIAKGAIEHTLAVRAGKDFQGQLENNITAAQALGAELLAHAKIKIPTYISGIVGMSTAIQATASEFDELESIGKSTLGKVASKVMETKGVFQDLGKDISTVFTNTAQSIAKSFFDGDTSVGEKLNAMWKDMGAAVLSKFLEPATKAIGTFVTDVIGDLLSGKGLGGVIDSIKDIGAGLGKIFGIGTDVASTAANAGGAVAQAGGAAAGAVNAGASAAGQVAGIGMSAMVGMVTGVLSAASGIWSNFQNIQMEKGINEIEKSTRYVKIWTGEQPQSILWSTQTTAERLNYVNDSLNQIGRFGSEQLGWLERIGAGVESMAAAQVAGGGGLTVNMSNITFANRDDIDYLLDKMAVRMRETGQTI